jgi:hypothetical protein
MQQNARTRASLTAGFGGKPNDVSLQVHSGKAQKDISAELTAELARCCGRVQKVVLERDAEGKKPKPDRSYVQRKLPDSLPTMPRAYCAIDRLKAWTVGRPTC